MQETQNKTALVWFRNDLRVHDNQVLQTALNQNNSLLAVYCFDPRHFEITRFGFKKTEKFRAKFLIETLKDLQQNLSTLNIHLITFFEQPETVIPRLIQKHDINSLYLQKEWTEEEVFVFDRVKDQLPSHVQIFEFYDQFLYHPDDIPFQINDIPKVFTEFRKVVEKDAKIRTLTTLAEPLSNFQHIEPTQIPSLEDLGLVDFETHSYSAFPFKGGESYALKRLKDYFFETKKLGVYKKTRNGLIGPDFSSKFSPWLANGSLSPRTVYWEVKRFEEEHFKNESTYWLIFELIWRDYFKYISLKYGNAIFKIGGILHKNYKWNQNEEEITNWIEGRTVEPFVNANMIEIKKTGWMSNRGRQNVASYFAKSLGLDWRIGASYFESMLIDYDVHSNYGNWMYVSGVGNDPRDRHFNVKLQAERYDSNGSYQHLWLQKTLFE